MATRKDRVKPTPYPFLWFHLPRSAQLVSSLVVAGIMSYFLRELSRDGYTLPWTFILVRLSQNVDLIETFWASLPGATEGYRKEIDG